MSLYTYTDEDGDHLEVERSHPEHSLYARAVVLSVSNGEDGESASVWIKQEQAEAILTAVTAALNTPQTVTDIERFLKEA